MADLNINPEDLSGNLGPFDSGSTDIKSFLPFEGAKLDYPEVNTPSPVDRAAPGNNLNSNMYSVKDYITGLPPYVSKTNNTGKMTAQQKANAIGSYVYNNLNAYQDNNAYAKMQSYDPSSNGAHRARYQAYGQETFDKVGFNPLINNEALFNENTSTLDDLSRMFTTSFFPLLGRGVIANPKSYAGLFTGDFGQDISEALAYEEYNSIGYSSKGGLGAFINNTLNSFAYTAGILVEAAAEEALVGAMIGSRGGVQGAGVGAGLGAGTGLLKGLFQLPKALYSMGKNGTTMLNNLRNLDNISEARTAFNAASKTVGDFLNPVENITNNLLRTENGLTDFNNLGNLARAKNNFASFYLDVRNMNMALSEARLEGGFVENNTYKQLYDDHYAKFGEAPDNDKQREFRQTAKQAGADASLYNSALIFYSNKLVFPTIMKGSMLRNMSKHYTEDIIDLGAGSKVILGKEGFQAIQSNLKTSLKALKNPLTYGRTAAGYFKANITEGVQENLQDVIADYTQRRYTEAYNDPAKMTYDYKKGLFKDALLKQITPQGFETFASGFVMGGYSKVLSGGYNLLSENYTKYVKDPKGYDDYVKGRKETAESIATRLNSLYDNPGEFFKTRYFNYGHQVLISKIQDSEDTTQKEMIDSTDDSFITNLTTALQTNTMHHFVDNLQKIKGLSPEELEKELKLAPGEGQKAYERIDTIISRAKRMQKRYDSMNKLQSGIDLNNFKEGTDEYRKAALFDEAFKISKANLIFFGESFDRNLERIQNLSNEVLTLTNNSQKIKASDVMALTSKDRFLNEMNILRTDIESLKNVTDPRAKKELLVATEKLEALEKMQESFAALEPAEFALKVANEITKNLDESITDEELKQTIETKFSEQAGLMAKEIVDTIKADTIDYLKKIIDNNVEYDLFVSKLNSQEGINSIDSLVTSLIDLHKLDTESAVLASASGILNDPQEFLEHVNRNFTWMEDMYRNRKEYFKDVVNSSIEQKEQNDLLEKLAEKGIYIDLEEFAAWIEDKTKIPTQFEDDINKRIITQDTPLYREYASLFIQLANIQEEKPAGEKLDPDELLKERIAEEETKMQQELDEARKQYDNDLKEEIGYTEQELKDVVSEAVDVKGLEEEIETVSELLTEIGDLAYNEEEDFDTQAELIERALNLGITQEAFEAQINSIVSNKTKLKKAIDLYKADSNVDLLNTDQAKRFAFYRAAMLELLTEKIEGIQSQIDESGQTPQADIEATEAKKKYDTTVKDIKERYKKIKDDLLTEYGKKGAKAKDVSTAKKYEKVSTTTPWYELPEDLRTQLEAEFQKYKKQKNISKETDEGTLDLLRQKWLETQGPAIEAYNNTKAGEVDTEEEVTAEPPVLTFKATKPEELEKMNLEELKNLLADLQKIYNLKKYYDPKKKKLEALSKAQITKLNNEIKALNGYIAYRRSIAGIAEPEQEVLDVIQTLIKNADENVELIKDSTGKLIGRRIKGIEYGEDQYAARVTSEKERILKLIDPNYEAYLYDALKPQKTTDKKTGKVVESPSRMEIIYNRSLAKLSDDATNQDKVKSFIEQLKSSFVKSEIKKFGAEWKYKEIEKFFADKEFNYDNVYEIISTLANRESSVTGTLIDTLARDYLSGKLITKPKDMSESAFKNLKKTLDKILDRVKDGTYTIVPKDILLYDKDYVSEDGKKGLVGEIDLLLIDKDKNFYIIDFKTGHSGVWKYFNAEPQTIDLTESYKWKYEDAPKVADVDAVDWDELGYESYEDFQAAYNGELSSMSLIETKGPDSIGTLKGRIRLYFKKGSKQKPADLDVTFTKGSYTIKPDFSRKPDYATQLTFYRNLFNNLTDILPKKVRLLPFETKINEDAYIESLTLAAIADPETGFLDIEPVAKVNEILPLKELGEPEEDTEVDTEVDYEEYKPKSYDIDDNIGKTVLYQGEVGTLIKFQKGYGVETATAVYHIDNGKETNILNLGMNTIKLKPGLFTNPVVNGDVYDIQEIDGSTLIINDVEYKVQRNKKGGVKSLEYRINDAEIVKKNQEIQNINDLIKTEVTDKLKGASKAEKANLSQKSLAMSYKLDILNAQLEELINTNKPVITRNKDLIAAVQALPSSFNNSTDPEDEENDVNDIKNKSDNSSAIEDMYEILQENMPENFDKLITDITSVTKTDLDNFVFYSKEVISKLEDLKSLYEGKGTLTTNITREIEVFKQLLNYITNLDLTQNGKVRKTKVNKEKQERLQQDVSKSFVQESEPGEAGAVPKQKAKRGRKQVNNTILQPLIFKLLQETASQVEEGGINVEEDLITREEIVELFDKATPETIDEIYFNTLDAIRKGVINLPNTKFIDNLKKEKEKEFSTKVTLKNISINDILLSKAKSDIWRVTEVLTDGVEIIKDITNETKFISTEDIAKSYLKYYKNMPIQEEPVVVDQSDLDASNETAETIDDVLEDDQAKQDMVEQLSKLSKEERRARLKKNNKCD